MRAKLATVGAIPRTFVGAFPALETFTSSAFPPILPPRTIWLSAIFLTASNTRKSINVAVWILSKR